MTIRIHKISDGYFASDDGTCIPGIYDSKEAAELSATLSPEAVQAMWYAVLESGRDTATIEDINRHLSFSSLGA